tara:strand:+ start:83 stop:343 length:261 start_codon:yes stop_codon:yes gene_type:complete
MTKYNFSAGPACLPKDVIFSIKKEAVLTFSYQSKNDNDFLDFCSKKGLMTLKGHRSVGGFRASIYNAMPIQGVKELTKAMREYSKK